MRVLLPLSFVGLLSLVACSSNSDPPPPPSGPQSTLAGTFGGKPFTGKVVIGYQNASDAGAGPAHQTFAIFETAADCFTFDQLQRTARSAVVSYQNTGGPEDLAMPAGGLTASGGIAELTDYSQNPPVTEQATAGTLTVTKEATTMSFGAADAGASSYGHIVLDMTAGADHLKGEADYVLCF
jgi:hypothetical protein